MNTLTKSQAKKNAENGRTSDLSKLKLQIFWRIIGFLGSNLRELWRNKILGLFHGFFLSFGFLFRGSFSKTFSGLGKLETPERSEAEPERSEGFKFFPSHKKVFEKLPRNKNQNSKRNRGKSPKSLSGKSPLKLASQETVFPSFYRFLPFAVFRFLEFEI